MNDVLSGVDELAHRGIIDPSRVCLYGHSNGGSTVSYLVSMTNRFKCAVVAAPAAADWLLPAVLQTDARAAVNAALGGIDFNKDVDDFTKMSAVFQLYKSKTPMLIVSGDNDRSLVDAISAYNAVRDTGTPVTLVRYPDQGHVLTGSAMADFWHRQMDFFGKYLQVDAAEIKIADTRFGENHPLSDSAEFPITPRDLLFKTSHFLMSSRLTFSVPYSRGKPSRGIAGRHLRRRTRGADHGLKRTAGGVPRVRVTCRRFGACVTA